MKTAIAAAGASQPSDSVTAARLWRGLRARAWFNLNDRRRRAELLWTIAAMGLQISGQIALVKLLTARMYPAEYGVFGLFSAAVQLLEQVFFMPFIQGAIRLAPTGAHGQVSIGPFRAVRGYWGRLAVLALLASLMAGLSAWYLGYHGYALLAWGVSLLLAAELRREYWMGIAAVGRLRSTMAFVYGADSWGRCFICFIALAYFPRIAVVAVVVLILVSAFTGQIAERIMRRRMPSFVQMGPGFEDPATRAHMWEFAAPWATISACVWGQRFADRWIVALVISTYAAGLYIGAAQLGVVIFQSLSVLGISFAAPILYHEMARGVQAGSLVRVRRLLLATHATYWGLGLVGVMLLAAFRRLAVHLLLGPQYSDTVAIVVIIAIGSLIQNGSQMHVLSVMVTGHTKCLLLPEIASGVAALGLDFRLVRHDGIVGAAYALVITAMLRTALMAWASARAWRKNPLVLPAPLAEGCS
ncbi:MAG TPA: hypothetical protein VN709_12235 [Terriglobales bacterium]|nr:hypothetical protein [Terriglobales bacterium]